MKKFIKYQGLSVFGICLFLCLFISMAMYTSDTLAVTCSITTDETLSAAYIAENACTDIEINGDLTLTWSAMASESTTKAPIDLGGGTWTISGGTVIFDGVAYLGDTDILTISSNAIVTHNPEDATGVNIIVGTMNVNGSIDAGGMGCLGGSSSSDGEAPDESSGLCSSLGTGRGLYQSSGGGHGGAGAIGRGLGWVVIEGGTTYDVESEPNLLGSGGGGGSIPASAGGGRVHLVVYNTLTLNGAIIVDGTDNVNDVSSRPVYGPGGGSGGSVYIRAGQIDGAGSITARGGHGGSSNYHSFYVYNPGGGGGGGRVALYYAIEGSFTSAGVDVVGGAGGDKIKDRLGTVDSTAPSGSTGTVYMSLVCLSASDCTPYSCDTATSACRESCEGNLHCDTGNSYVCNTDSNECVAGTACSDASACDGYACDFGIGMCMTSCTSSAMCDTPNTYSCNADGDCEPGPACTSADDCGGYACRAVSATGTNHCTSSCEFDLDCRGGYNCSSGVCVASDAFCNSNDDCTPYGCEFGLSLCKASCSSDLDCDGGSGAYCDTMNGLCTEATACATADDCSGYKCGLGTNTCMRSCSSDDECYTRAGYSCDTDSSTCVPGVIGDGTECFENIDCRADGGYKCDTYLHKCYTSCETDSQCRGGGSVVYSCVEGVCSR